jgi:hypothetical protein
MTVKELIAMLQSKPPYLLVAYMRYSEYCLLEADDITILPLCAPREDGWVHSKRPDKPSQNYLVLPGN